MSDELTPREILRRVTRLEISTRRLVEQSLAGSYHSVFRGRGMEFSEVREYDPGDDVRSIDWNVSARMGHPYVKQFTEERELTVLLVVDVSASKRFGTGIASKVRVATEVAAILAFSATRNNDRVGAVLFTDRIETFVPPRRGREHALRVLREIVAASPEGRGTDLSAALTYVRNVVTKRAVVLVVSDFQDEGYGDTLRVVSRKHDVVAIGVDDPREHELPRVGLLAVVDPETGAPGVIDTGSRRVREAYARHAGEARERTRDAIRRAGVEFLELSTAEPYERHLARFFRERARRARKAGA